jgi:hypothetical protein
MPSHASCSSWPSKVVWAKVKTEKSDRSEFWATLKAKKYVESKNRFNAWHLTMVRVRFEWVVFFSKRGFSHIIIL